MKNYIIVAILIFISVALGYFSLNRDKFGSTITTTNSSDSLTTFRTNTNTNLANLNTDKLESGSTAAALTITTLTAGTVSATSLTLTGLLTLNAASTTSGTFSNFFQLPNSSSQSPTIAGQVALDTTSGQLKFGDGSNTLVVNGHVYRFYDYATSTTWAGTTTRLMFLPYVGETLKGVACTVIPSGATVNLQIGNGSASTTVVVASSTVNKNFFTSNNSLTALSKYSLAWGSPVSSPVEVGCTTDSVITAD